MNNAGLILLVGLGILLSVLFILILCILILPFRYKFSFDTEKKCLSFLLTGWLRFFSYRISYDNGLTKEKKIFWVIKKEKEEEEDEAENEKREKPEKKKSHFKGTFQTIKDILFDHASRENFKGIWNAALLFLKRVVKAVKPKKSEGNIDFGFSSPMRTGEVFGIISLFLSNKANKGLTVIPHFNEEIMKGNGTFSGSVSLGKLLIYILLFLKNPYVKEFRAEQKRRKGA